MSDRFPNLGALPSRQGHAPSLSAGAASAQSGMVRIQRGSELRYIWPVHLPGWLASGWRVGSGETRAEPTPAAPVVVTPDALSSQPPAATPARSTPGPSGQRPAVSAASAPHSAMATTTSGSRDASSPSAGHAIAAIADPDSPRQPEADLTAHLPTNLLDLDQAPEEPAGQLEEPATGGDLPEVLATEPAEGPEPEQATETGEPPAKGGDGESTAVAEPAEHSAAEQSAPESPAPRRGRPRKVRQDLQPENQAEPAVEVAAQEQPAATLLSTAGDDLFGIDPLL